MRHLTTGSIVSGIICLFGLTFPSALFSEVSTRGGTEKTETGPMVIKSDAIEIDNKQKIVTFIGNVDARRDTFIIKCRKMLVYYQENPSQKQPKEGSIKIDKIVATGAVTISRTDGGLATAEKAVYYQSDEKVILTGKPVVKRGTDFVEGSRITLFLKEKRSIVEGSGSRRVKAVLSSRSENR